MNNNQNFRKNIENLLDLSILIVSILVLKYYVYHIYPNDDDDIISLK